MTTLPTIASGTFRSAFVSSSDRWHAASYLGGFQFQLVMIQNPRRKYHTVLTQGTDRQCLAVYEPRDAITTPTARICDFGKHE